MEPLGMILATMAGTLYASRAPWRGGLAVAGTMPPVGLLVAGGVGLVVGLAVAVMFVGGMGLAAWARR